MAPFQAGRVTATQEKAAEILVANPRRALAGPFVPLLRSPEFMGRLQNMSEYLRFESRIGTKLAEFTTNPWRLSTIAWPA